MKDAPFICLNFNITPFLLPNCSHEVDLEVGAVE